jgi:hypothetical protein
MQVDLLLLCVGDRLVPVGAVIKDATVCVGCQGCSANQLRLKLDLQPSMMAMTKRTPAKFPQKQRNQCSSIFRIGRRRW